MKKNLRYLIATTIFCISFYPLAEGKEISEPLVVQDLAEVLNEAWENGIRKAIEFHESKTANEIAILIVESLEGEILEDYSLRVARTWGVGKKTKIMDSSFLLRCKSAKSESRPATV